MKITSYEQCKTGMRVRCKIEGEQIDDAILHVEGSNVYICQNVKDGTHSPNKHGYAFSWCCRDDAAVFGNRYWEVADLETVDAPAPAQPAQATSQEPKPTDDKLVHRCEAEMVCPDTGETYQCHHDAGHHGPHRVVNSAGKFVEWLPNSYKSEPSTAHPAACDTAASLLESARAIVSGDRQRDYGHPADNHACTALMWQAYLHRRATSNGADYSFTVTAEDVCALNILQKVSRLANTTNHVDSLRDIIGYALNWQMILDRAADRKSNEQKGGAE